MLDTYREVITPEGVPLQLPAAGPVPRALAWLVDLMVRFGVLGLMSPLLMALGGLGQGLHLGLMFLLFWGYPIVLEVWFGQTLGKRALGLRVVAEGVEDMPQAAWLHDHGCEEAQGYLYAPALDAAALQTRLLAQQAEMAHG